MRSRSTAVLSLTAIAVLALAGCATQPASDGAGTAEPSPTASVAESSYASPAVAGERTGVDGTDLQLWSSVAPDEGAVGTLGDPDAGNQWVTVNVAQWTAAADQTDVDVAPVLRSTADESFTGTAVSPRAVDVPMTADKLYTFAWSFQVPENLVDATSLVLCTSADADAACTSIDK
ncbi:hypothetical protein [Microbacterium sp. bgisy203]|uniref:hypothetical protein n=1 Tax=Microbacterium sp. bgisy203 TaxID=3413799 RepID=UPI003D74C4A4